ncbi:hypothetical protein [Chlamydia caviae]|uniref:Uncharacterized protein n=1 Tax=Chlamydia caviae (strain ATCC VR-813 / DSM 19441 / 03DC25 / GPIC) TaxID=227941 RepID=Q823S2_CHLCV|nr:hypothetical protein [Chlamydia caviae]AAP05082.1 hypothetical protein CCA_00334 [Chlamydia caviae GPIC]
MGVVQIPQHTHVNENNSVCLAPHVILPEVIHGCPMAPEAMITKLQHLPLLLIPIVGLVYAGIFYRRYTRACTSFQAINGFTPNTKCPQCRETSMIMVLPIVVSVLGGLGFMLPLLILLLPILLITGLVKAILGIGRCVAAGVKCCGNKPRSVDI